MQNNIIKEFHSIGNAAKWIKTVVECGNNPKTAIIKALKNNHNAYGYKWQYI